MRGREAAPHSEVTATRLVVNRVCGPEASDTPVPLDTESGDTLGLIAGSVTASGSEKKQALCNNSWQMQAKAFRCCINGVMTVS